MTHTIRKQRLQIKFNGSESDGLVLQKQLMDLYYNEVLPELEKAFDSSIPDNQYLVFERLAVDLGNIKIDQIGKEFTPAVVKAVMKKIGEGFQLPTGLGIGKGTTGKPLDNNIENKDLPVALTKQEFLLRVFAHFLKSGNLPWFYKIPAGKSLEEVVSEVLKAEANGYEIQRLKEEIVATLAKEPYRKRLNLQFSADFCNVLINFISPETAKKVYAISQSVTESSFTSDESKTILEVLQQAALLSVTREEKPTESALKVVTINYLFEKAEKQIVNHDLTVRVLKVFGVDPVQMENYRRPQQLENIEPKAQLDKLRLTGRLEKAGSTLQSEKIEPAQELGNLPERTSKRPMQEFGKGDESKKEERKATKERQKALSENVNPAMPVGKKEAENLLTIAESAIGEELSKEGIYIENAGLVLLHPFLPRLFENLKISEGKKFLHANKALCLLHYLTTGRTKMPEYELVLPKILCQVSVSVPVPIEVELTGAELEEADALLSAVIKHWRALRDTSHDGLRSAFLLRPGKVTKRDDGDWLIQIENRSFDILLDQLPWGISMIKLPWMKQMLWVEWRM